MTRSSHRDYFYALEGIRGIAALLVAARHMIPAFRPVTSPSSYLAVDIFFLLSGFVLAASYEQRLQSGYLTARSFFALRLARIYPLYMVGTLFGFFVFVFREEISPPSLSQALTLAVLFLPNPDPTTNLYPLNPPAWSLLSELVMSFIYGVFLCRARNAFVWATAAVSGAAFTWATIAHGRADIGFQQDLLWAGMARIGLSFSVGVLVYRHLNDLRALVGPLGDKATIAIFGAVVLALTAPVSQTSPLSMPYAMLMIFIVFPVIMIASVNASPTGRLKDTSIWLGRLSFPLYAVHAPVFMGIEGLTHRITGVEIGAYAPWAGPVVLAAAVWIALLVERHFDRPLRSVLKTWLSKKSYAS